MRGVRIGSGVVARTRAVPVPVLVAGNAIQARAEQNREDEADERQRRQERDEGLGAQGRYSFRSEYSSTSGV
jgi:hypothetical protein